MALCWSDYIIIVIAIDPLPCLGEHVQPSLPDVGIVYGTRTEPARRARARGPRLGIGNVRSPLLHERERARTHENRSRWITSAVSIQIPTCGSIPSKTVSEYSRYISLTYLFAYRARVLSSQIRSPRWLDGCVADRSSKLVRTSFAASRERRVMACICFGGVHYASEDGRQKSRVTTAAAKRSSGNVSKKKV
ncbi:hypothetical protein EVAR_6959_1 [Eumeta japonica]|uniref:Uncharacterized protein n=1 Tax=Eumeta variegata TaxID=151549 RepID=A0A4C1TK00_EUMVA|nr:hypothetical protein EVAR_6959_1 [Eumeta japonica]